MADLKQQLTNETVWKEVKKVLMESFKKENSVKTEIYDILFENMRQSLLESTFAFSTMDQAPVIRVLLGISKRLLPKLIAPEIVSVQPMRAPVGIVKVKKVVLETTQGQKYDLMNFTQLNTPDHLPQEDVTAPKATTETLASVNQEVEVILGSSGKIVPNTVTISYTLGGREVVLSEMSGIIQDENLIQTINYETRTVTITPKGGVTLTDVVVSGITSTDWEYNVGVPRMRFEIVNLPINAITRKLRASWTYEQMEDQNAEMGGLINLEEEIYNDVSAFIAQEINREILSDLVDGQMASATWVRVDPNGTDYLTQEAYFRTLLYKINAVAQEITRKTQIAPNFIVLSPVNWQVLEDGLSQYIFKRQDQQSDFANVGFSMVGEINSRYKVYVTPSISDSAVLVGYKGQSIVDSGYVYAPYVPLKGVPVTFETVPGIQFYTRYGKKLYQPWFYGKVNITTQ